MVFEDEGLSSQIDITATDISREALERGRAGQYRDWSLRSLDPTVLARHFRSARGTHTVYARLRHQIDWRQLNLAESSYVADGVGVGRFALIFCRNVLMFFDAATIARVAQRLWASLLPGGWLFLGPSDPNVAVHCDFEVIMTAAGLVYRRPPLVRSHSSAPLTSFDDEQLARNDVVVSLQPMAATKVEPEPDPEPEPAALAQQIRQACNAEGAEHALTLCMSALKQQPDSAELHHLHALLLWELCRYSEAAAALRRVLFLDGDNAIAHFGLGTLLERQGAGDAARRSYHNVLVACEKHAPEAPLPLGDGICAAGLRAAAAGGLARLKPSEPETP
jgi:chemotaxis protein methyltransferase CheR